MVVIGVIVIAAGAYAIWTSQNEIDYVHSCAKAVACGTPQNVTSKVFLTPALSTSLWEAQLGYVVGILMLGVGLVLVVYGVYLHPERRSGAAVAGAAAPSLV